MSQQNVERVIGRLVTDEGLRRRFTLDPARTLRALCESGVEVTATELQALVGIDPKGLTHFAATLDPRLQKCDLHGDWR